MGGKEFPEGGDIFTLLTGSRLRKGYNRLFIVTLVFTLYIEDIIRSATRMDELPAGIKIARGNINNLRYADDTTLMAESGEELKRISISVKEKSEKTALNLKLEKPNIKASTHIISWQIEGEKSGSSDKFYFLGLQNHCRW